MIRGTTTQTPAVLQYSENITAWLRCEEAARDEFFEETAITLRTGDERRRDRVQLRSMHPTENIVLCAVTGEVMGGEHHGQMALDFAPTGDERFRVIAREADLDAICEKTEMLATPASAPPRG